MSLFDEWIVSIRSLRAWPLKQELHTTGVYKLHTGGVSYYAMIDVRIEPSATLELCYSIDPAKRARMNAEGWGEATLFGVLDVFVLRTATPILPFKLTIEDMDFHEIDSGTRAFRMAGRRAAEKCLEMLNNLDRSGHRTR